ncbi:hypothetical protein D3C86_1854700 [compost metagenome]
MRPAGNRSTDNAQRLLLESGQEIFILRSIGDEADTEAPYEFFLGGSVNLDGKHARVQIGKTSEQ